MPFFCADSEYTSYFFVRCSYNGENGPICTVSVIFPESSAIVALTKPSQTSFYLLTNISKDAEFHRLSEYVTVFSSTQFYNSNDSEKQREKLLKARLDDIESLNMFDIFSNEQAHLKMFIQRLIENCMGHQNMKSLFPESEYCLIMYSIYSM